MYFRQHQVVPIAPPTTEADCVDPGLLVVEFSKFYTNFTDCHGSSETLEVASGVPCVATRGGKGPGAQFRIGRQLRTAPLEFAVYTYKGVPNQRTFFGFGNFASS